MNIETLDKAEELKTREHHLKQDLIYFEGSDEDMGHCKYDKNLFRREQIFKMYPELETMVKYMITGFIKQKLEETQRDFNEL